MYLLKMMDHPVLARAAFLTWLTLQYVMQYKSNLINDNDYLSQIRAHLCDVARQNSEKTLREIFLKKKRTITSSFFATYISTTAFASRYPARGPSSAWGECTGIIHKSLLRREKDRLLDCIEDWFINYRIDQLRNNNRSFRETKL